ncbi:reticulon-like protein B15 [Eutrema salsugineum]|uniref:reticulon-like protein B15 n=1 Tax=Eutrema salsugineum TaxID=72664 RepID=UPI000CED4126|nr:reticulon-like protein B15 [Eutrema salsugineum]
MPKSPQQEPKKSLVDQILGDGAVADLCLWKDKIKSGITLAMATLFWYMSDVQEIPFVPLLCSILLLLMLLLFLWANFGQLLFTLRPPTPAEMKLEDSPLKALVSKIESLFLMLYEIAYGKDIITFLLTILYVATIDTVASYFNLVTFLYICFFCSMTIPVYYLRFQEDIDSFFGKQKKMVVGVFKSSVLDKIPRAAKKE